MDLTLLLVKLMYLTLLLEKLYKIRLVTLLYLPITSMFSYIQASHLTASCRDCSNSEPQSDTENIIE